MRMNIFGGRYVVVPVLCGMAAVTGDAHAMIDMPEREHIQTIVWAVEFVSFVTAMGIVWIIWRISKRDSENRKAKRDRPFDDPDR
jgi:hypothetical protein